MNMKALFISLVLAVASVASADQPPQGSNVPRLEDIAGLNVERDLLIPHLVVPPQGLTLGGYAWFDTGVMARTNSDDSNPDQTANYMGGRVVLRGTYYRDIESFFAMAKVELAGFDNELLRVDPHVMDAYLMVGQKRLWDFQLGRFLGWEVYDRGRGFDLFTAEEAGASGGPSITWLEHARGRLNETGQAAFHLYPIEQLAIELGAAYGQENGQNVLGVRPTAILSLGDFQVLGGAEYRTRRPQTSNLKNQDTILGFAGQIRYSIPQLTIGLNYGQVDSDAIKADDTTDAANTYVRSSYGAFTDLNFVKDFSFGLGYHYTTQSLKSNDLMSVHHQAFISALYRLPITGLSVKAIYGYALADIENAGNNIGNSKNDMNSARIRVAYEFY